MTQVRLKRFGFTLGLLALLVACDAEKNEIKPITSSDGRKDYELADLISQVNSRSARRLEHLANAQLPSWSEIAASVSPDPQREFASKVVNCGATEGNWAVLELDRTCIEAALQISVSRGIVTSNEVFTLRHKAERQLFKKGGRSFVVMHNHPHRWALPLVGDGPRLISQANGRGYLIGMSVGPALGIKAGELGLLIFEDRVVGTDASYAVQLVWTREPIPSDSFWGAESRQSHHFTFGGENNPLAIIASVYQPTLPPPRSYEREEVRVRNVTLSGGDMLSLAQFAWQIVSFLTKL